MSECKFNRCDGSGELTSGGMNRGDVEVRPCPCAVRDTVPSTPDEEQCRAMGCEGCPACIPGYVP